MNCTQIHHSVEIRSELQAEKPVRRPPQVQAREDEANCAPHSGKAAGSREQEPSQCLAVELGGKFRIMSGGKKYP